jgi:hypothetical protein
MKQRSNNARYLQAHFMLACDASRQRMIMKCALARFWHDGDEPGCEDLATGRLVIVCRLTGALAISQSAAEAARALRQRERWPCTGGG